MKHQPFEMWVFMQDELNASEQSQLQAHFETCEACRSLSRAFARMEKEISNISVVAPKPGFTNRWRLRLASENANRKQRNMSMLFGILAVAASLLFIPIFIQVILLILSPGDLINSATNSAFDWLSWIGFTGDVAYAFMKSSIETFPAAWWGVSGLVVMVLTVTWFISIHRFSPNTQFERSTGR